MNKRKLISCVFLFLSIIFIVLSVVAFVFSKKTENNTNVINGTIESFYSVNSGDEETLLINITEFDCDLAIMPVVLKNIKPVTLKRGDKILFGVDKRYVSEMNSYEFVEIVSLKVEKESIFTLKDYNSYLENTTNQSAFFAMCLGAGLLVLFFVRTRKYRNKARNTE